MTMAATHDDLDEPGPSALALDTPAPRALWRPRGQADLAPSGEKAKARANLAALGTLRALQAAERPATPEEAALLARWAGWGAIPNIFDEDDASWASERAQLKELLLTEDAWRAARRTVLNAHYTSAEVASAMWEAAASLGFSGGRVLEPGCGSGNFIGLVPEALVDSTDFVGVELDETTAAIAAALYPHADIRAEGFEDTRFPPDAFDLVMGNVPFAKVALHDPTYNKARHSIHNHFILKSLQFLRPGGLALVLTSRYTLDSRNSAARRAMAEMAELVGAVRFPEGAFYAAAGTQAIEDLLILRRRTDDVSLFSTPWTALATVATTAGDKPTVEVNEYFAAHPDYMLGEVATHRGMYRDDEFTVKATGPLSPALTTALDSIVAEALQRDLGWLAPAQPKARQRKASRPRPAAPPPAHFQVRNTHDEVVEVPAPPRKEGTILATDGLTGFGRVVYGVVEDYEPTPRSDAAELRMLVRIRDVLLALLNVQATTTDDTVFAGLQRLLNRVYDEYVERFGPINRFNLARTGRKVKGTEEDQTRRIRPRMGGFRLLDPDFPSLVALEIFDPDTQRASKAAIFSERVVAPRERARSATDAKDALLLCLDQHGDVRIEVIAQLLGVEDDEALAQLGTLVWKDPDSGEYLTAQRYLSGNVRQRLARARMAALDDPFYSAHVAALEEVVPVDLLPSEIDARLGCTWIPTDDVALFVKEVLGSRDPIVRRQPYTGTWTVGVASWERASVAMSSEWGTRRADAARLVENSCNQKPAAVYDELDDKRKVLNVTETLNAREKQELIEQRFSEWVWDDTERASRLAAVYNELFNSVVTPVYDGTHLTLPGLSSNLTPHPHQLSAIWRGIQEPTLGLFHPVGAGKTLVMAATGMELRRLGLVRKPMYVVPNHMLHQFCAEFLQHYPRARVLLATKESVTPALRKQFVARCATGDWDAIIITQSTFERIPLSPETRARFLERKMADLTAAIRATAEQEQRGFSVKRLEKALQKMQERHERLLAEHRKDDGVNFDESGVDYLFVDEAHLYKNMAFGTHVQGVGGQGSQRAEDLEAKLLFLRGTYGARVCTLATATPVANTLAEVYVMQCYLQPEVLEAADIRGFDAWAANFGRTVNQLELSPDGSTYRIGSRFARFANVPELMAMFRAVADIRLLEDLDLQVPRIAGGAPETVVVPPTDAHAEYMELLAERAEDVRNRLVDPTEDNMLKVSTDGRKAALHLRLVGRRPDGPTKVEMAAERIALTFHDNRHVRFKDRAGHPAVRPGGFQLVFCDLGTPHDGTWHVYDELKAQVVERDVPAEMVRFIHEAKDDRAKEELFAACRDGRVAVLIASTEKAGIGTNIQDRMVALHHLDCPWRPCDIEQRDGRGIRQGNQNDDIRMFRYVTERTFDTYLWQTVSRKAAFIHQVMSGKFKGREVDDFGEQALSFAEVKALATGNPLLLEQAGVAIDLEKLVRSRRAHSADQSSLARTVQYARERMAEATDLARMCEAAIARRQPTDPFTMELHGHTYTRWGEAGTTLLEMVRVRMNSARKEWTKEVVGSFAGFPVTIKTRKTGGYGAYEYGATPEAYVELEGVPHAFWFNRMELSGTSPTGVVQRLIHRVEDLEVDRKRALMRHAEAEREAAAADARLGVPFPQEAELVKLERRAKEIADEIGRIAAQQEKEKAERVRTRRAQEAAGAE